MRLKFTQNNRLVTGTCFESLPRINVVFYIFRCHVLANGWYRWTSQRGFDKVEEVCIGFVCFISKFFQELLQSLKQYGSRPGWSKCSAQSGSKLFANVTPAGDISRQRIKKIYDGILFNVTSYVEALFQCKINKTMTRVASEFQE